MNAKTEMEEEISKCKTKWENTSELQITKIPKQEMILKHI